MSKTIDLFNKIIAEAEECCKENKENKEKVVDGAEGKPAVIQEENEETVVKTPEEVIDTTKTEEQVTDNQLDQSEQEFIKNLIKAAELQAAHTAINDFIKDLSSVGTSSKSYVTLAKDRLVELNEEFKTVVNSIKSVREDILKEAEKAKNKENLVSIFDKAVNKAESESQKEIEEDKDKKVISDTTEE